MSVAPARPTDSAPGLRGFLFLEAVVRLFLWNSSFALTIAILTAVRAWPHQALVGADLDVAVQWSGLLARFLIVYNFVYLGELLVFRALLPTPREGTYALVPGQRPDRRMLAMALLGVLVKAKGQPPFPAFLLFHVANLPPMCWLVARVFGPRSQSVLVLDPPMPDPHLTEIGRNVVVGNMTSIIAHTQYRDHFELRKTVIEDNVMIGAHALIYSGCTIRRGAVVYGGAVVPPNTVVGENEAWGGVPARKIKDLPPQP